MKKKAGKKAAKKPMGMMMKKKAGKKAGKKPMGGGRRKMGMGY